MVLRGSVQGSSTLLGWGVLASYTAISTGFNIAHAPGGLLEQASHAIPPTSLCISVELLMNIIRSDLTADLSAELTAPAQLADKENRADRIRSYIELHPDVTAAVIARSFGITRQTASRYRSKVKTIKEKGIWAGL